MSNIDNVWEWQMPLPFYSMMISGLDWSLTTLIGIFASTFTAISLMPQLVRIFREKRKGELSLGMLLILLAGCSLWVVYGIRRNDFIIISSNALSLLLNFMLLGMMYRYRGN